MAEGPSFDVVPIVIGGAAAAAVGLGLVYLLTRPETPPPGTIPTAITIGASPNPVDVGQPVTIAGRLTRTDTGAGISNKAIAIEQSVDQLVWQEIGTMNTLSDGTYAAQVTFSTEGTYFIRTRFAGGAA